MLSPLLLFSVVTEENIGLITLSSFSTRGDRGGVIGGMESCLDATTTSGISRHGESGSITGGGDGDVMAIGAGTTTTGTTVLGVVVSGMLLSSSVFSDTAAAVAAAAVVAVAVTVKSSDFCLVSLPDELFAFEAVLFFFEGISVD